MSNQVVNVSVLMLLLFINQIVILRINGDEQRRVINIKSHFFYKSNAFMERSCDCTMGMSCNCCESVVMLFMQITKRLCANFMYQRNGLNVDISLNSDTLRTMTVRTYRPFIMCTSIPGSLYSLACLNVLELNNFPRSITACARLDIKTKAQDWKLNYRCMGISTTLPIIYNETVDTQSSLTAITAQIMLTTPASSPSSPTSMRSLTPDMIIPSEQMQQNSFPPVNGTLSRAHTRPNSTVPL